MCLQLKYPARHNLQTDAPCTAETRLTSLTHTADQISRSTLHKYCDFTMQIVDIFVFHGDFKFKAAFIRVLINYGVEDPAL